MAKLSYDELERAYRGALRREVRLLHELQAREAVILRLKGKLLAGIQELDFEVGTLALRQYPQHPVTPDHHTDPR